MDEFAVLAPFAIGALFALVHPLVLWYLQRADAAARTALRHRIACSAFILLAALAWAFDLSFAGHALNLVAAVAVLLCAGFLIVSAFGLRPRLVGVTAGLLASGAWIAGLLFLFLSAALMDQSPATVQLDDGLICRETMYGLAAGDSGDTMAIYRRYLFIDHRLLSQVRSDTAPENTTPPPPAFTDTLARCRARVNAARSAAAHLS